MNPLDRIQSYSGDFTKTDHDIAIYIINHPHETATQNIDIIAKKTNSSKSAIVRFTKKIGYTGYAQFRFELSRSLVARNNETHTDDIPSPVITIPEVYSTCLLKMKNSLSHEQAERIAQYLKDANRIKILGTNRTFQAARQFKQRLGRMGYDAEAINDPVDMQDAVDMSSEKDVFIIFTTYGKGNYDLTVRELKNKGASVVLITMSDTLSYREFASECVILPAIDSDNDYSFLDNQVIFFVYIEILLNLIARNENTL